MTSKRRKECGLRVFLAEVEAEGGLSSVERAESLVRAYRERVESFGGTLEVGYPSREDGVSLLLVELPDRPVIAADELMPDLNFREVYGVRVTMVEDRGIE
jgi:hypothetical protein